MHFCVENTVETALSESEINRVTMFYRNLENDGRRGTFEGDLSGLDLSGLVWSCVRRLAAYGCLIPLLSSAPVRPPGHTILSHVKFY